MVIVKLRGQLEEVVQEPPPSTIPSLASEIQITLSQEHLTLPLTPRYQYFLHKYQYCVVDEFTFEKEYDASYTDCFVKYTNDEHSIGIYVKSRCQCGWFEYPHW